MCNMSTKVVFICPGGRKNILSVQLMYMMKILDLDIVFEYHIWNFSWNEEDYNYISNLNTLHDKIKIKYSPYEKSSRGGEVASKQFAYFLAEYYNYETYKDCIFVKSEYKHILSSALLGTRLHACLRADPRRELPFFDPGIFANFCKSTLFFAHFCASERA